MIFLLVRLMEILIMSISTIATTKMSSKGQVVIPEEIREYLELENGSKFIVMAADDSIILKKIHPVPQSDLMALLKKSKQVAKANGLKQSDITEAIKAVRAEKRRAVKKDKLADK